MLPKLKKLTQTILLSLLLSLNAYATQHIRQADNSHKQAVISAHEQNRLAIAGRRIASVVPSTKGLISAIKDEAVGALYFTLTHATHHGSLTLFVSDDQRTTYKLILQPRAIPGAEIILHPPKGPTPSANQTTGSASSYLREIKEVMLMMAQADDLPDTDRVTLHQEVKLWKETRFILLSKYNGVEGLVGEKYRLTNISLSPMQLAEQEFYRSGVLGVAIEQHALTTGQSTHVFIVREKD